jgi:hypothetical protein
MIIDASSFINFSALSPFSLRSAPDAVAQWIASATGEDKEVGEIGGRKNFGLSS